MALVYGKSIYYFKRHNGIIFQNNTYFHNNLAQLTNKTIRNKLKTLQNFRTIHDIPIFSGGTF